jgi:hypothetical protein
MEADKSVLTSCSTTAPPVGIGLLIDMSTLEPSASVLWEDGNVYELVPKTSSQPALVPKTDSAMAATSTASSEAVVQRERRSSQSSQTTPYEDNLSARTNSMRLTAWIFGTILVSLFTYI